MFEPLFLCASQQRWNNQSKGQHEDFQLAVDRILTEIVAVQVNLPAKVQVCFVNHTAPRAMSSHLSFGASFRRILRRLFHHAASAVRRDPSSRCRGPPMLPTGAWVVASHGVSETLASGSAGRGLQVQTQQSRRPKALISR